jgi:large subunit ribosomal protein L6
MSKIGKRAIIIPDNVEIKINDGFLEFKSTSGDVRLRILPDIKAEIKEKSLLFTPENNSRQAQVNWGTVRSLAYNAIIGLTEGFSKALEIEGIGYRANMEGDALVLNLGLSHPVKFVSPAGIKISVEKNTIKVSGVDKALVTQTAAKIKAFKKPEPYKGKGIKYQGEIIRRKAGKKVAGTEATAK